MCLTYHLAAYWPAREESIDQCADRAIAMFSGLGDCSLMLARWYTYGSHRVPLEEHRADVAERAYLVKLLDRGRRRRDLTNEVIEDQGFAIQLYNGQDGEDAAVRVSICCGVGTPWAGNSVIIALPTDLGTLADPQSMREALAAVVRAWDPKWAGVFSAEAAEQRDFAPEKPFADWMIYLCRDLLRNGTVINGPGRVTALGGKLGVIVSTQDEPPDPQNPQHVHNIDRVRQALCI